MQAKITEAIFQKVPRLTEEQPRKILEMTETFLNGEKAALEEIDKSEVNPRPSYSNASDNRAQIQTTTLRQSISRAKAVR